MNFLSLLLLVGEEPALLSGWPTFFNRNIFLSTLSCLCTEGRVNYLAGIGWLQFFLRVVELASSLLLILVRYKLFLIELNSPTSSTGSFLDSRLSVCGFSMEFHCLTRVMEVWRLTFGLALAFYLGLTLMKGLLSISSYQGQMVYICQYCLFLGLWKTYQMLYWFWLQEQPSAPSLNNFIYYIRLLTCSSEPQHCAPAIFIAKVALKGRKHIYVRATNYHASQTLGGDPFQIIFTHSFLFGLTLLPFQSILVQQAEGAGRSSTICFLLGRKQGKRASLPKPFLTRFSLGSFFQMYQKLVQDWKTGVYVPGAGILDYLRVWSFSSLPCFLTQKCQSFLLLCSFYTES